MTPNAAYTCLLFLLAFAASVPIQQADGRAGKL
jgi:hypothetical protein